MASRRRLKQLGRLLRRHMVVGPTLAGYLALVVGMPLPLPAVKDASQPFPCQNHQCGCLNADQCWHHCCCYSPEEHLAWARAHQVDPPAFVQQGHSEEQEWATHPSPSAADHQEDHCPHCRGKSQPPTKEPARASSGKKLVWTLALHARHCRGEGALWLSDQPVFVPPPGAVWRYDWAPATWLAPEPHGLVLLPHPPPAPPPRV